MLDDSAQLVQPDEKDQKIQQLEEELGKLKDKEMNFEKLRHKTEETAKEKQAKETELEIMKRQQMEKIQEIEEQNRKWREDQFSDTKEQFFKNLCGDDRTLREKLEFEMEQLKGEVNTVTQLKNKMEKAYLLVQGTKPEPSVFGRMATTSAPEKPEKRGFPDTPRGQEVLNKITRGQVDWNKVPKKGDDYFRGAF